MNDTNLPMNPTTIDNTETDTFEQAFNDTLFNSFDSGYYIGMMSGTSLDGLDVVICQFDDDNLDDDLDNDSEKQSTALSVHTDKLIATHSAPFPEQLRDVLMALSLPNGVAALTTPAKNLILEQQPQSELEWFGWANREYAEFASQVVNDLLEKANMDADAVLAIGCHGQTVRHRPLLGFSLQLVDPNIIAERTGISVVSDFRRRDMAVGGQGAPLAPTFHLAQFGQPVDNGSLETSKALNRVVVNLGGIANISVLPANQPDNVNVIGYDTGPANMLLDGWYQAYVQTLDTPPAQPLYDEGGQWAQTGTVNEALLAQLLSHPYFEQPTPKSTGREDFNLNWLNEQIEQTSPDKAINVEDVQATLTALTVTTLANAIKSEAERLDLEAGDIIVCGGGAYNSYLLDQLANTLTDWQVLTSEDFGIAPTWVEAMAFAWLARQTIMGETGNMPAVTGASKAVVLGQVCFA